MLDALYTVLIGPVYLLIEVIFVLTCRVVTNPGWALVAVSLLVNLLILPLYRRADALQEEERKKQKEMSRWVTHIRKTFTGDMRYMILSEYYRQCEYKPYYVLRSSLSIVLQVPFFIAAYRFLSTVPAFQGVAFMGINNLGAPDALLAIGKTRINLLPVLMTLINLCSGAVYLKEAPAREKVQVVGLAALFLVLLYGSPACLVIYWTCNNLFSLIKNVVTALLRKRRAGAVTGTRALHGSYVLFCVALTLLTGLMIPAALIDVSPADFVDLNNYADPLRLYLPHTCFIACGCFLVWAQLIWSFASARTRKLLVPTAAVLAVFGVLTWMFFGRGYGWISNALVYDKPPVPTAVQMAANMILLAAVIVMIVWIVRKKHTLLSMIAVVLCVSTGALGIYHVYRTASYLREHVDMERIASLEEYRDQKIFSLSTTQKNVVVIMPDRAIGALVPYIFAEFPELKERYDGFTFYPNTVSHGPSTLWGAAGLYGGYEYTPEGMATRADVSMHDKYNEALALMPVMFRDAGYRVMVCDQPFGNYESVSDLSFYADLGGIGAVTTEGLYTPKELLSLQRERTRRNFFFYSLFRTMPLCLQGAVYDGGAYLSSDASTQLPHHDFIISYPLMERLSDLTVTGDDRPPGFLIIDTQVTHGESILQMPDYSVNLSPHNEGYNTSYRIDEEGNRYEFTAKFSLAHYCVDAFFFLHLADWLDTLRAQGVYDNTRIIIVADHGFEIDLIPSVEKVEADFYNPLFMVKDFDASGWTVDETFMTNADTPYLATQGLMSQINPFLGTALRMSAPGEVQYIKLSENSNFPDDNPGNLYRIAPDDWGTVHDDILDDNCWEISGPPKGY